jgi:cation:H+ antiporter
LTVLLLLAAFGAILAGAFLFTNAVEWLGNRLRLGTGTVGSVIAAVATALPESVIPIVAIIGGRDQADDVAIGAIIGAPFMLGTVAMALVGVSAVLFQARRDQRRRLQAHQPTVKRDLTFFLVLFGAALAIGIGAPTAARVAVAAGLVLAYATYVVVSLRHGGEVQSEEKLAPLRFDPTPRDPPAMPAIVLQFMLGLGAIIGGAHLFVHEILALAEDLGVAPLVLSLVLTPLATELPEKANSVLWIRDGKDSLALGNITGAMVFQSTIPAAVGIAFTRWELDRFAVLAAAIALAGGGVAIWVLHLRRRFTTPAILAWAALFATGATVVIIGGS